MFEDDICLCGAMKCLRRNECLRGDGRKRKKGIYTISDFSQECNQNNNYKMFIKGEKV